MSSVKSKSKQKQSELRKVGLYIRVSTEEQAENPEGSIRNQEDRLRSAIQQRNLDGPFGEVAGVFIDRAKSGKDTNRAELQKLLTAIRKHEIDLVMVSELSRLSRSIKDFSGIWEMMQENGCGFLSLREAFDTTTAAGEMVLYTVANIAQFERRQVSERVSANIQARAARGLYNGGTVPLGYTLIPEKRGYLAINSAQAEIVKAVFNAYPKQGSLSATAKWLNANGYRCERNTEGGGSRPRLGHFMIQNVESILKNKAYIGVKNYKHKGETIEAKAVWEPLIERDLFERIQKQLKANKGRLKPDSFKTYPYLLSGFVVCGQCGGNLCGKSAHGCTSKVAYYEHSWLTRKNGCLLKKAFDCKPFRIGAKVLEPLVWEKIEEMLSRPEIGRELIADAKKRFENDAGTEELSRVKVRIYDLGQQMEVLAERLAMLPKTLSPEPIFKQMEKLQALKLEEEKRMQGAVNKTRQMPVEIEVYEKFLEVIRNLKDNDGLGFLKAKIIKALVHRIEIGANSLKIHYRVGLDDIERELMKDGSGAAMPPGSPARQGRGLSKFSDVDFSSRSLTNGAAEKT